MTSQRRSWTPQSTDDVFEVIKLMKDMGRTIVLVEHKMEQIARYSDHIIVLDQGRVVLEGTPREVITNPDCAKYHTRLPQCTNIGLGLKKRGSGFRGASHYNRRGGWTDLHIYGPMSRRGGLLCL